MYILITGGLTTEPAFNIFHFALYKCLQFFHLQGPHRGAWSWRPSLFMTFRLLFSWRSGIGACIETDKISFPERALSQLENNLESRKGNFITKDARSGMKKFVSGI